MCVRVRDQLHSCICLILAHTVSLCCNPASIRFATRPFLHGLLYIHIYLHICISKGLSSHQLTPKWSHSSTSLFLPHPASGEAWQEHSIYKCTALPFVSADITVHVYKRTYIRTVSVMPGGDQLRGSPAFPLRCHTAADLYISLALMYTLWVIRENWVSAGQESKTLLFF